MTDTLREKLIAAAHTEVFHGSGHQLSIALDKVLAILNEHCNDSGAQKTAAARDTEARCRELFQAMLKEGNFTPEDEYGNYHLDEGNLYWLWGRAYFAHHAALKRCEKTILLAARWFKLYQEDKTRYEHPASDADLLGMFDAMRETLAELKEIL